MTRREIEAFYERRVEAMHRRDAQALALQHHEDGILESPLAGGSAQGREAIEDVYEAFIRAFPDVTIRRESLLVDGDRAVLVLGLQGTDSGGLMGLPPTGRPFSMSIVFVDELKDGLITRERRIYDFTGLLLQLGAIKVKPV